MVTDHSKSMTLLYAAVLTGLVLPSGCRPPSTSTGAKEIKSSAIFNPGALYSPNVILSMSDTEIPVVMRVKKEGSLVIFESVNHDTVLETEKYDLQPEAFSLVELVETYNPPIKLIGFPMSIKDSWEWSGVQTSASIERKAKATITSSLDNLSQDGVAGLETVKITVALEVESGVSKPRESKLEFWFAAGKGIVKRTYGTAIMRRPAKVGPKDPQE
ncbi:MAG: hypothetical protein ABL949_08375 [Fimbriimonadaceae bacterium]